MTLVKDLPIFRKTYELTSVIIDYVAEFPRVHKFTLGDKMVNVSLALFEYIQLANRCGKNKQARVEYLCAYKF